MKRFWKEAAAAKVDDGFAIQLDGRPVKTPGRHDLVVPSENLAKGLAEEWNAVAEKIDPSAMPMTGLANAAIERVGTDPISFAASLAKYGENDLTCYRADSPDSLVKAQAEAWDPLQQWASKRYDIAFHCVSGVMHVPQPDATVETLSDEVSKLSTFELAGLSPLVTAGGSLVAALAVKEGAVSVDEAWKAVSVDERYQAERWGEDEEAKASLATREKDFRAGARFLTLL